MLDTLKSGVSWLVSVPLGIARTLGQIATGAKDYALEGTLTAEIGNFLYSVTVTAAINALTADDPDDQVTGALIMIWWSFWTSLFTGFVTAVFILFWLGFLFWGVFRWSDAGDQAWNRITPDWSPSLPSLPSKKFEVGRRRDD
ncbi:hypothetical protein [Halostella litorea]|uniref:hypothetical protein n=1 Tax=Halostella litorea TaxID=2528831 RepID=UPI001091E1D4|nr:hypothetical protein [Halostella litorea]